MRCTGRGDTAIHCRCCLSSPFYFPKAYHTQWVKYAHMQSVQIRLAEDPVVGRLELDMRSRLGILWHVDQVLAIEAF